MTWVYFTGIEGCAFQRTDEFADKIELWPDALYPVLLFLSQNEGIHDLCWQTDHGITYILKRKLPGETVTAPC